MRRLLSRCALIAALALVVTPGSSILRAQDADTGSAADELQWPRVIQQGDLTFTVYQPQIDTFDDTVLEARAAVQVEEKVGDKTKMLYGVVWIKASTFIDKESRLV